MSEDREKFLSRWSRLKQQAKEEDSADKVPAAPAPASETPPVLPPVDKLGFDSDYRGFFHPKVDENVRRAALKRLFIDPHFNVMDGLDVYIEDYSKPDPLPAAMLAQLRQAQKILEWATDARDKETEQRSEGPPEVRRIDAQEAAGPDVMAPLNAAQSGSSRVDPGAEEKASKSREA